MSAEAFCDKKTTPLEVFAAIGHFSKGTPGFVKWCREEATTEQVQSAFDSIYRHQHVQLQVAKEELDRRHRMEAQAIAETRHLESETNEKTRAADTAAVGRQANRIQSWGIAIASGISALGVSAAIYFGMQDRRLESQAERLEARVYEIEERERSGVSIGSQTGTMQPIPAIRMPNGMPGIPGSPAYTIPQMPATPAPALLQ